MQIDEWNDCDYVSARSTESHQSIDGSSRRMDKCEIVRKIKFNQLSICYASIWFCWMDPKIIVTNGNGNDVFVCVWACVLITWKCDYCTFFISISACSSAAQKHKKPAIFFRPFVRIDAIAIINRIRFEWLEDIFFIDFFCVCTMFMICFLILYNEPPPHLIMQIHRWILLLYSRGVCIYRENRLYSVEKSAKIWIFCLCVWWLIFTLLAI